MTEGKQFRNTLSISSDYLALETEVYKDKFKYKVYNGKRKQLTRYQEIHPERSVNFAMVRQTTYQWWNTIL